MDGGREMNTTPLRDSGINTPPPHIPNTPTYDDNDTTLEEIQLLHTKLDNLWRKFELREGKKSERPEDNSPTVADVAIGGGEMKVTPPRVTKKRTQTAETMNNHGSPRILHDSEMYKNKKYTSSEHHFNDNFISNNKKRYTSPIQTLDEDDEITDEYESESERNTNKDPLKDAKWTIPPLTKKNYSIWKNKVDWALYVRGVDRYVQTRHEMPGRRHPDFQGFTIAYGIVANNIHHEVTNLIGEIKNNPYDLYHRIVELFNPKTAGTRLINRIKYFQLRCHDMSITKFCSKIENMSAKIDSFSLFNDQMLRKMAEMSLVECVKEVIKVIDEADRLAILLGGLNDVYQTQEFVLRADPNMTYDKAKEVLENAQFHLKSDNEKDSVASASEKTCTKCKKNGHLAKDCWSGRGRGRGQRGRGRGGKAKDKDKNTGSDDDLGCVFMASEHVNANTDVAKYVTIDSGATQHVAGANAKSLLEDIKTMERATRLHLPNGETLIAREKGNLKVVLGEGKADRHEITNVVLSDQIKGDGPILISVAKLCDKGAKVTFDKNKCQVSIKKNGRWVPKITAKRRGNLYQLPINKFELDDDDEQINIITNKETKPDIDKDMIKKNISIPELQLMHQRLGHCNIQALKTAIRSGNIKGVSEKALEQVMKECTVCAVAKIKKTSRPKNSTTETTTPLERTHCDTSGKMRVPTYSGRRYFSVIVDEATRHVDVRLLKNKNEVSSHLKQYKSKGERLHNKKMKVVRTDNAKEYLSKEFKGLLNEEGIETQQCTPHEHSQNPYAERTIGVITNIANTLLAQSNAPPKLWGEAVMTAAVVHELTPKKVLEYKTPFELWRGRKPDLTRLKTWGCLAIPQTPKHQRWKFDKNGCECIMIGYDLEKKAWRLMRLDNHKLIVSCHVKFFENIFPYKVKKAADMVVEYLVPGGLKTIKDFDNNDEEDLKPVSINLSKVNRNINRYPTDQNGNHTRNIDIKKEMLSPDIISNNGSRTPTHTFISNNGSRTSTPTLLIDNVGNGAHNLIEDVDVANDAQNFIGTPGGYNSSMVRKEMTDFDPTIPRKTCNENPVYSVEQDEEFDEEYLFLARETLSYEMGIKKDPANYGEAVKKELDAFSEQKVFRLVPKPDVDVLFPNWVLERKWDGRHKARLTINGKRQIKGMNYDASFAATLSLPLMRIAITLMLLLNMTMGQYDVPTAFLNSKIDRPVYMYPPKGYKMPKGKENWVWELLKCLYGLKQASRMWRSVFHDFLVDELGFKQIHVETCMYIKITKGSISIIVVYVDDFILGSTNSETYLEIEKGLINKFNVKKLKLLDRFLGMNFTRSGNKMFINQKDIIEKMCTDYNLGSGKDTEMPWPGGFIDPKPDEQVPFTNEKAYRSAIGTLLWIAMCTRPDIAYHVNFLSTFSNKPLRIHWEHVKRIIVYLRSTANKGILLNCDPKKNTPTVYCDASHGDPTIDRKSTTGFMFFLCGAPFYWASRRQKVVSISSCEAEYYAMSEMAMEAQFFLQIFKGISSNIKTVIANVDSEPARRIASGDASLRKVKHIETRYHFVRDMTLNKQLELRWITKDQNVADILTKAMENKRLFTFLRDKFLVDAPVTTGDSI